MLELIGAHRRKKKTAASRRTGTVAAQPYLLSQPLQMLEWSTQNRNAV